MKYISKAQRQLDGDLLLKADSQALLYRAVHDVLRRLSAEQAGRAATDPSETLRALTALQDVLGTWQGDLPTVNELLGDPAREALARNLLKG